MIKSLGLFFLGVVAHAATLPCAVATLQSYDTSGFSCSESSIVFSNFTFTASGTDVPLPSATAVEVTPLSDGLEFDAGFSAPVGLTLDVTIGYVETIAGSSFTGAQLAIGGFGQSGSGSIDVAESLCLGAAFSSAVCPASLASLNVFDNSSGFKASDSMMLNSTVLGVIKDISISGGSAAANVSLIDNVTPFGTTRSATPEPQTVLLVGTGFLILTKLKKKAAKI